MSATIGYRFRYAVAWIALRLPGPICWWLLDRKMFRPVDDGSKEDV